MLRTVASPEKFWCHIWSDNGAEGKELWMSLSKMCGGKKIASHRLFGSHRLFFQNLKLLMSPATKFSKKKKMEMGVLAMCNPMHPLIYQTCFS